MDQLSEVSEIHLKLQEQILKAIYNKSNFSFVALFETKSLETVLGIPLQVANASKSCKKLVRKNQ